MEAAANRTCTIVRPGIPSHVPGRSRYAAYAGERPGIAPGVVYISPAAADNPAVIAKSRLAREESGRRGRRGEKAA
jgi:hypothetical protein